MRCGSVCIIDPSSLRQRTIVAATTTVAHMSPHGAATHLRRNGHARGYRRLNERRLFVAGTSAVGASAALSSRIQAQDSTPEASSVPLASPGASREGEPKFGFVLSHEQFRTPDLLDFAVLAEQAGFDELWTSDHFQPWQDNEQHAMFP